MNESKYLPKWLWHLLGVTLLTMLTVGLLLASEIAPLGEPFAGIQSYFFTLLVVAGFFALVGFGIAAPILLWVVHANPRVLSSIRVTGQTGWWTIGAVDLLGCACCVVRALQSLRDPHVEFGGPRPEIHAALWNFMSAAAGVVTVVAFGGFVLSVLAMVERSRREVRA